MSTARGDGEIESTQILAEDDLEEVGHRAESAGDATPYDVTESTVVMEDSQLRELVEPRPPAEPSPEQEAALRKQREAERAAREREEALARVRAHRRQSANTRALRPAATPPPEAKVALSDNALDMLDKEIEPSDRPPARTPQPGQVRRAMETSRPKRATGPMRNPGMPPPAPRPDLPPTPARMRELQTALDEVEACLKAQDVQGALAIIARVKSS